MRIAFCLLLVACTVVHAEPKFEPIKSFPILGGRLTIKLTANGENSARGSDSLMSASQSLQGETRVVTKLSDGKLVFFAKELYKLAPDSTQLLLASQADAKLDSKPVVEKVGELQMIRQNPSKWVELVDGGELAESALVVLPDHTIVQLGFFVTPSVKDKAAVRRFAKDSLGTLIFQRKLATGGTFDVAGVIVKLPEFWVHVEQLGLDFSVDHFYQLVKWEQPAARIGIYEGSSPSYQYDSSERVDEKEGNWLGREVTWHISGKAEPRLHETIIELADGSFRHVWYAGDPAHAIVDAMALPEK